MYFLSKNQKKFLSNLNPFLLLILIFCLTLLRTTGEPMLPNLVGQWDILLPFVVYFGQRRSLVEGVTLTILASHMYSLCSSAPIGVFIVHYLLIYVMARALSSIIYANQTGPILLLLFGLSVLGRVSFSFIAQAFGENWGVFWQGFSLLSNLVLNCLLGFVVYVGIRKVDKLTYKVATVRLRLSER